MRKPHREHMTDISAETARWCPPQSACVPQMSSHSSPQPLHTTLTLQPTHAGQTNKADPKVAGLQTFAHTVLLTACLSLKSCCFITPERLQDSTQMPPCVPILMPIQGLCFRGNASPAHLITQEHIMGEPGFLLICVLIV